MAIQENFVFYCNYYLFIYFYFAGNYQVVLAREHVSLYI